MAVLVQKSVARTLFSMAFPMLAGTFAINAYNLTDTYFVSRLGTLPLAAMGFTFPVVMLLGCVSHGIGVGVTTLMSHAIGRHDHDGAARLVTHGIFLMMSIAAIMSICGYLLITPIFKGLGADATTLPLIAKYMRTWFAGAIFMALPMVGSGILISSGNSKGASLFIIMGMGLNVILDPVMIFGYFGFPTLGIRGAALATVIAQATSTILLIYVLSRKHHLIALRSLRLTPFVVSLQRIMSFAVPGILSMILMPISATVITRILSGFGHEAIAAIGAAGRIEMFAFVIPMALGISLTPFVSQNFGAQRLDRIHQAQKMATAFALLYGGLIAAAFFAGAPLLASIFTDDPIVFKTLISYIQIISFGYGMMEVHRYCGFIFTGLHRPVSATVLNAIRVLVFLIPLSYLGGHYWGVKGVFWGRLATDITVGSIGLAWVSSVLHSVNANIIEK